MKITPPAFNRPSSTGTGGSPSGPAGGDNSGSYPAPEVSGIKGYPIAGSPSDGDVIVFDAGTGTWVLQAPSSTTPTGPAGGDLSGTYPNPTVAAINGATLGTTTGASTNDWLRWTGSAWAKSSLVWRPVMATDDGGDHYYVVVDGDGTAVMALS